MGGRMLPNWGCLLGSACAWMWGGRVEVWIQQPRVTGRREELRLPVHPESETYGVGRDVQSSPPPAWEAAFAGSCQYTTGICFEQGPICIAERRKIALLMPLSFFDPLFICSLNYLFVFPLQSSFDRITWKYGYKADGSSLPSAGEQPCFPVWGAYL